MTLTALVAVATPVSHGLPVGKTAEGTGPNLLTGLLVSPAEAAQGKVYHMRVDGITCPFCVKTSEKALRRIPGVQRVSTNLKKGVITVCASPSANISAARMRSLFAKKGFTFRSMSRGRSC